MKEIEGRKGREREKDEERERETERVYTQEARQVIGKELGDLSLVCLM